MRTLIPTSVALTLLLAPSFSAFAQGTAFNYQGRLNDGANPAQGSYDLRFIVYDNAAGGNQQGPILTNAATSVSGGRFAVTLDFGQQFPGAGRWLEIAVRTNGLGNFSTLSPRQALLPTPYAITAGQVVSGGLASGTYGNALTLNNAGNQISGSFTGNGAGVTNVNAATLGGLSSAGFWRTNGNTGANPTNGAFLGSTDNQALEFKVNNRRAMRYEYANYEPWGAESPNLIGGYSGNVASNGVIGGLIAGGGYVTWPNKVGGRFASVLGGYGNVASGDSSVAMGQVAIASGGGAFAVGYRATASGDSAVAMGVYATASGYNSTALGNATSATGEGAFTAGGNTLASGTYSTALGYGTVAAGTGAAALGFGAQALHGGTFVWSDGLANFSSTANNQFLVQASGGVGLGTADPRAHLHVYSANNPTVVRIQSTGTPGFGRVEFVSNPQGDGNEWRPSYIQSTDAGGFTGGLSFVVNGTGAANKFAEIETMRIQNGRVGIGTASPVSALQVVGTVTATAFNPPSDRNLKENFVPVNPCEVLEKVAALPISRWNFKGDADTAHLGPMAQDFYAAFGTGTDERHIATVDADGVALAAIQGLNRKVEEKNSEIAELKRELAEIKRLLQALAPQEH